MLALERWKLTIFDEYAHAREDATGGGSRFVTPLEGEGDTPIGEGAQRGGERREARAGEIVPPGMWDGVG